MGKTTLNRRQFLNASAKSVVTANAIIHAPYVITREKPTLRVMGTHVTLQETLRQEAMKTLGINIQFEPKGSAAV